MANWIGQVKAVALTEGPILMYSTYWIQHLPNASALWGFQVSQTLSMAVRPAPRGQRQLVPLILFYLFILAPSHRAASLHRMLRPRPSPYPPAFRIPAKSNGSVETGKKPQLQRVRDALGPRRLSRKLAEVRGEPIKRSTAWTSVVPGAEACRWWRAVAG